MTSDSKLKKGLNYAFNTIVLTRGATSSDLVSLRDWSALTVEQFDNIYSGMIYEKGAHVIGMLPTHLGWPKWRASMDEYFSRFDGKTTTIDDFLDVMQEVSGKDLTHFRKCIASPARPKAAVAQLVRKS